MFCDYYRLDETQCYRWRCWFCNDETNDPSTDRVCPGQ